MDSSYLMQTLRGRERLAVVFWRYWVLGQLGVVLLLVAGASLVEHVQPEIVKILASVLIAIPVLAYEIWVLVSLWTCAFNVRAMFWGYCARAYVVLIAIGYLEGAYEASRWVADRLA